MNNSEAAKGAKRSLKALKEWTAHRDLWDLEAHLASEIAWARTELLSQIGKKRAAGDNDAHRLVCAVKGFADVPFKSFVRLEGIDKKNATAPQTTLRNLILLFEGKASISDKLTADCWTLIQKKCCHVAVDLRHYQGDLQDRVNPSPLGAGKHAKRDAHVDTSPSPARPQSLVTGAAFSQIAYESIATFHVHNPNQSNYHDDAGRDTLRVDLSFNSHEHEDFVGVRWHIALNSCELQTRFEQAEAAIADEQEHSDLANGLTLRIKSASKYPDPRSPKWRIEAPGHGALLEGSFRQIDLCGIDGSTTGNEWISLYTTIGQIKVAHQGVALNSPEAKKVFDNFLTFYGMPEPSDAHGYYVFASKILPMMGQSQ